MKISPSILVGLIIIILGLVLVIAGAVLKINQYSDGWITGNNLIIIGMAVELIGIFIAVSLFTKSLKK
ncbi:hypothetical protein [Moheibacter lacus]|uniref:Uncharacterized protein n=1 Tax=Moheibacter lacus TaxID=2745851 RepID=A0A838ZGM5_9FLAO|nr:hypothetical protein [Moheibacter lacus]MBA5628851.1 hypothetical protein [Moheibacter lacus]